MEAVPAARGADRSEGSRGLTRNGTTGKRGKGAANRAEGDDLFVAANAEGEGGKEAKSPSTRRSVAKSPRASRARVKIVPLLIPQPKSLELDADGRAVDFGIPSFEDRAAVESAIARVVRFVKDRSLGDEAYRLLIEPRGVTIEHAGERGAHYALSTLHQLLSQYAGIVPCMRIEDAPDFAHRGYMLDVSRGKVPRLETLYELVDLLSFLKYNHFELYVEHVYAWKSHPLLGKGHSPLTPRDVQALDAYCASKHVEFVPNLQSFGHHWHTLKHSKYKHLAESDYRGGWTLSPVEPGTYDFLRELYDEFLPNFRHTRLFNVGCDETWDLCKAGSRSAKLASEIGPGRVYLRHLLKVHEMAAHEGRRILFWGDVIANHPETLKDIPKDVILLNWCYEAHGQEKQYAKRLKPASKSGLEHWVAPGTSTWNSLFFRMTNARVNLRKSAKEGLKAGAKGYLVTDWGDHHHYNFQSWSLWPIAYGADCAWRVDPDKTAEKRFDDRLVKLFLDETAPFGEPMRLLGDLYQAFGVLVPNNSAERWLLTGYPVPDILGVTGGELRAFDKIALENLEAAREQAERAVGLLERLETPIDHTRKIRDEWLLGGRLALHACRRVLWHNHGRGDRKELAREIENLAKWFEEAWLERNRESDLADNRADFQRIAQGYAARTPEPVRFE